MPPPPPSAADGAAPPFGPHTGRNDQEFLQKSALVHLRQIHIIQIKNIDDIDMQSKKSEPVSKRFLYKIFHKYFFFSILAEWVDTNLKGLFVIF